MNPGRGGLILKAASSPILFWWRKIMDTKSVAWETDWKRALERARSEGKAILLDFFNPG